MKIVVAPDSFKGSMSSIEVCNAVEKGVLKANKKVKVEKIPLADGGEGTVEALTAASNGTIHQIDVTGPLGENVLANYGILGDRKTAVIEMAAASGLPLVPKGNENPLITTSYGTGELIKAAIESGCTKIIIGIGGSATNDGGIGMAQALGVKFFDQKGAQVGQGGQFLEKIEKIDISGLYEPVKNVEVLVACDVTNPMCGLNGASYIYGPQKGATEEMIIRLDAGMAHYANVISEELGKDVIDIPGSGAAGGLGGALVAFLNATLKSGIDIMIEASNLADKISDADFVITGEGKTDYQTAFGKVPAGVAKVAKAKNVPTICLAGGLGDGIEKLYSLGITSLFSIVNQPMSLEESMANGADLVTQASENITRLLLMKQ